MRDLSRLRRNAHLPLAALALALARPNLGAELGGTALVLVGLAVRAWAAGTLVKGGELCTDGPYRYVRHPLYLGSFLGALGFCVMTNSLWGWAVILPVFALIYIAQVSAEERWLRRQYGDAHAQWARRVPMLLPRLPGAGEGSSAAWRWSQFLANREHYHALITLALTVMFYLRPYWGKVGP